MTSYAWECPECGFDWRESGRLVTTQRYCGMCAGDSGDDVRITTWKPTDEEISELSLITQSRKEGA